MIPVRPTLSWLSDFLHRRRTRRAPDRQPAPTPAREIQLPPFHPIIFANGRDDDTEGLKAFMEGRPVLLNGHLVTAGDARIANCSLRIRCGHILIHDRSGNLINIMGVPLGRAEAVSVGHGWKREIVNCHLLMNAPVEP